MQNQAALSVQVAPRRPIHISRVAQAVEPPAVTRQVGGANPSAGASVAWCSWCNSSTSVGEVEGTGAAPVGHPKFGWSGDRASERLRLQPACAGSVTLAGLQSMRPVFPGPERDQQSNGLLSREIRVRVPGGPPFPDRITAVQPPLKRRVLVRLQLW